VPYLGPSIAPVKHTAKTCSVIGTGENGIGNDICANIAVIAVKRPAIMILFSVEFFSIEYYIHSGICLYSQAYIFF
jgi:hypothetical protein